MWLNLQETADLVTLTEEIVNGKLNSMCSASNLSLGPSLRTKISFFLLSTCTNELISTPKIIEFLPNPLPN